MRILVADGFEPWRRFVSSFLQKKPGWLLVAEASDGLQAVQKALEHKPDLILLEISLPKLSGIEAARLIRELAPNSKIIFATTQDDLAYVQEALRVGASGYVLKSSAVGELGKAVQAVVQGKRFVSSGIKRVPGGPEARQALDGLSDYLSEQTKAMQGKAEMTWRHELQFYSDDEQFIDGCAHFIEGALKADNSAVLAATEPHRKGIFRTLQSRGVNIDAAIDQRRYVSIDVAETVSRFMVNGKLDRDQFFKVAGRCIESAVNAAKGAVPRVAACGECAPLLLAQGKAEEAVQLERLWNELAKMHEVDIRCGYRLGSSDSTEDGPIFRRICAEHSDFLYG